MSVVDGSFGYPLRLEEEASVPLAGGITGYGFQCGMIWGAALAAGAEVFRRLGPGPRTEATAIMVSEKLVEIFKVRTRDEMNCAEITELNLQKMKRIIPVLKFFVKGGKVGPGACFRLAAGYAGDVYNIINAAFPEKPVEVTSGPVSCAAVLARIMGASEMHVAMVSGFAGGIGLSGGACGALGAAIWFKAMNNRREEVSKPIRYDDPVYAALIGKFLEKTDSEFECRDIVGKKFDGIEDHAAYLAEGGCREIIETLANS